jgi:hypothetical protein
MVQGESRDARAPIVEHDHQLAGLDRLDDAALGDERDPQYLASQLAPPHERALWFGLAGGTAALAFWRMWGWILRRVGIS